MFKNQHGFTLIEMLIVLLVITILILLIVPNITTQSESIHEKGCRALKLTVQAQVNAYELNEGSPPQTFVDMFDEYITEEQTVCENNKKLKLENGVVTIDGET